VVSLKEITLLLEPFGLPCGDRGLGFLQVGGEIEVAGTGLRGLPESLRHVRLTWDEVGVDERIAFTPEALTAREILESPTRTIDE
jgi:hypothetical protein